LHQCLEPFSLSFRWLLAWWQSVIRMPEKPIVKFYFCCKDQTNCGFESQFSNGAWIFYQSLGYLTERAPRRLSIITTNVSKV
jgi:hypothetical protein